MITIPKEIVEIPYKMRQSFVCQFCKCKFKVDLPEYTVTVEISPYSLQAFAHSSCLLCGRVAKTMIPLTEYEYALKYFKFMKSKGE